MLAQVTYRSLTLLNAFREVGCLPSSLVPVEPFTEIFMETAMHAMLSRRSVMKHTVSLGIGLGLMGRELFAAEDVSSLPLITKAIPSTGERLPVIGLGTNAFSVTEPEEVAARKEVLQHFPKLGARVVDT